jgi:hypothetical protein
MSSTWVKVVFAADLDKHGHCPQCWIERGEVIDYADCPCPGPTQEEEFEYKQVRGVLFARPRSLPA